MLLELFHKRFPDVAKAESRSLHCHGHECIPDGDYLFLEAYCPDPQCNCRRVLLMVINARSGDPAANISFGFDLTDPMRGPYLDPMNPQSPYAAAVFEYVLDSVRDPDYAARLERHYHMMKAPHSEPEVEPQKSGPWWKKKTSKAKRSRPSR